MISTAQAHSGSFSADTSGTPAGQAFIIQYVSLMLMILTFIIGAFSRGPEASGQPLATALPDMPAITNAEQIPVDVSDTERAPRAAPIAQIRFERLFGENEQVDRDALLGVLALLHSHDVRAEFSLFRVLPVANGQGGETLARAVMLSRFLSEEGIPSTAYSVIALERPAEEDAIVRVYSMKLEGR